MELLLSPRTNYLPPVMGSSFQLLVAIKEDDYSINELVDITAEATTGSAEISILDNVITIQCQIISDVIIEIKETNTNLFTYYSFRITSQPYFPDLQSYQNLLNSELPGDVFTYNPLDTTIWAQGAIDSYSYIQTTFNDIFPNQSTNVNWLTSLWSTTQQFFYTNPDFSYQKLFALLRNLKVTCTLNPFDQAWTISYFIYLITGIKTYVYVRESRITYPTFQNEYNVYIFGGLTPENAWILDDSALDENTYLDGIDIYSATKTTIDYFVNKIYRIGKEHKVVYNDIPETFGLVYEIENAYKGDPNLQKTYCIAYSPDRFTLADALTT